jgi:coenzyme F420-0:L-glutamate ligase/coenzyme F420-1:gamma-L-glutamate ligase
MAGEVRVIGVDGIPEGKRGDDPTNLIVDGLGHSGLTLEPGDIVVVTHKLVSKAEGRVVELNDVTASDLATRWAEAYGKDPRHVEVVFQEAARIVRMDHGLIIAETRHGFVCANAGVDASNVAGHRAVSMLPLDPDGSAEKIRAGLQQHFGFEPAVIITDSFGRPWRRGIINIAIGSAGINPLLDYRGQYDDQGYEMHTTVMAIADEIASAAELVMNKLDRRPVAIVRGYDYQPGDEGAAATLVMSRERDLFR